MQSRETVFNSVSNVCKDSLSFKMHERIRRQILLAHVNTATRMNEALYTVFKALGTEVISCLKFPYYCSRLDQSRQHVL